MSELLVFLIKSLICIFLGKKLAICSENGWANSQPWLKVIKLKIILQFILLFKFKNLHRKILFNKPRLFRDIPSYQDHQAHVIVKVKVQMKVSLTTSGVKHLPLYWWIDERRTFLGIPIHSWPTVYKCLPLYWWIDNRRTFLCIPRTSKHVPLWLWIDKRRTFLGIPIPQDL